VRRLFYLMAVLAVTGCGGSFFQSHAPPQSVYVLSAKAAPSGPEVPVDLTVLKPLVRTGLDSEFIAALYPDRRLDYFAGARWSGRLDDVVRDLALQTFRVRANLRNVHAETSAFGSGYWLEIDVADFQAEYAAAEGTEGAAAPTVHVHLLARVGSSADRRVLGRLEAEERQPAADNRLTAIVEAYNQAAGTALARIVADTQVLLAKESEAR